jgi:hypothetical protein
MFSQLASRWRGLPVWLRLVVRIILILVAVCILLFLAAFVAGSGSWSQAQAATPPRPSKAWVARGRIVKVRESTGTVAVATRNRRLTCAEQYDEKHYENLFGEVLIWLKMAKSWCYSKSNHEITRQPQALVTSGVSTVGALTQWKIDSVESHPTEYYPYQGWEKGGSLSWSVLKASRCFPTPFGCIQVGSTTQTIEILAYYTGSYRLS